MAIERKDIKCKNGHEFWLCKFTGKVASQRQWSETHVSQGAATVITSHNGHHAVIPGRISSSVSNNQEVWLVHEDGAEEDFNFTNAEVPLRDGHEVTVVWCGGKDMKTGKNLWAYNRTTDRIFDVRRGPVQLKGISGKRTLYCFLAGVGCLFIPGIQGMSSLGFLAGVVSFISNFAKAHRDATEAIGIAKQYLTEA